jgi:transcriptional regulator with XRE-family HTH domain
LGIISFIVEETINQRIKKVRESLDLSQRTFSKLLSASGGYIAGIEVGLRRANARLIKLIVSEFGVSEDWLRTGKGEMFSKIGTDEKSTRLLSLFNDLPSRYQDVIFGLIDLLRKTKESESE